MHFFVACPLGALEKINKVLGFDCSFWEKLSDHVGIEVLLHSEGVMSSPSIRVAGRQGSLS